MRRTRTKREDADKIPASTKNYSNRSVRIFNNNPCVARLTASPTLSVLDKVVGAQLSFSDIAVAI